MTTPLSDVFVLLFSIGISGVIVAFIYVLLGTSLQKKMNHLNEIDKKIILMRKEYTQDDDALDTSAPVRQNAA